jgi:hypothetical protein
MNHIRPRNVIKQRNKGVLRRTWQGKRIRERKNKEERDYCLKLSLICDGFTNHESFKLDARFLLQDQTEGTKEGSCTRKGPTADRTQQTLEGFKSVNPSSKDS